MTPTTTNEGGGVRPASLTSKVRVQFATGFSGADAVSACVHKHPEDFGHWRQVSCAELTAEEAKAMGAGKIAGNAACACSVLKARCDCPNQGNVQKAEAPRTSDGRRASVNVMVQGPPCQPFSRSGDELGEDDPLAWLSVDALQFANRCEADVLVLENVPQLMSPKHASFFADLEKRLGGAGYQISPKPLDPRMFSAPVKRPRLYLVCVRGLGSPAANKEAAERITADWPSVSDFNPEAVCWPDYIETAERLAAPGREISWQKLALSQHQAGQVLSRSGMNPGGLDPFVKEIFRQAERYGFDEEGELSNLAPDEMWFWDNEQGFTSSRGVLPTIMKGSRSQRGAFLKIDGELHPRYMSAWEVERFQGFPQVREPDGRLEGWTHVHHIPPRTGRRQYLSEQERYKLMGNSMSIHCLHFLLKRVDDVMQPVWAAKKNRAQIS